MEMDAVFFQIQVEFKRSYYDIKLFIFSGIKIKEHILFVNMHPSLNPTQTNDAPLKKR